MASIIRTSYQLPTLRCSVEVRDRAQVLRTQPWLGSKVLNGDTDTPFDISGNDSMARAVQLRDIADEIVKRPDHPVRQQIELLDREADRGMPLWLQIGQDSADAAILPWAEVIAEVTGRGTLRIPNYAKNPFSPHPFLRIAICISAPRAKVSSEFVEEVHSALLAYRDALSEVPVGTRIRIVPSQRL